MRLARGRPGQFGKAAARNAPVRHHRHFPAQALARLHHLRAGRGIADQDEDIGALFLQPCQLRHQIDVVVLEFLDAGDLDRGVGLDRFGQALLVRLAPGVVDEDEAGFLRAELLVGILQQFHVDQHVDRGDAEDVVGICAIARDAGAGGPDRHVRDLLLVEERHHRERDGAVDPAENDRQPSP